MTDNNTPARTTTTHGADFLPAAPRRTGAARCTGCGKGGTQMNPLLHGRYGLSHDRCDRP